MFGNYRKSAVEAYKTRTRTPVVFSSIRFVFDSSGFCELLAFLLWKTAGVATSSSFYWNNCTVRFENVSVQCQMPWVLLFGSSCYDREFRCWQISYSPTLMRWKLLNKRSAPSAPEKPCVWSWYLSLNLVFFTSQICFLFIISCT